MNESSRKYRKAIRLKDFDYSQPGAYFITICTHNKACVLGNVVNDVVLLNEYGKMVEKEWQNTAIVRKNVALDAFTVMPNHFHGIIILTETVEATHRVAATDDSRPVVAVEATHRVATTDDLRPVVAVEATHRVATTEGLKPLAAATGNLKPNSLGSIVGQFKSIVTRAICQSGLSNFRWQPNYYEHIIRDERDLNEIREYIANNPLKWALDRENPEYSGPKKG